MAVHLQKNTNINGPRMDPCVTPQYTNASGIFALILAWLRYAAFIEWQWALAKFCIGVFFYICPILAPLSIDIGQISVCTDDTHLGIMRSLERLSRKGKDLTLKWF